MNRSLCFLRPAAVASLSLATLSEWSSAAEPVTNTPPPKIDLDDVVDHSGWFMRLGGRVTQGLKATLQDRQAAPSIVPGQYDNGYVKPDISGSSSATWNWGYSSASSQIQGNTLNLSRYDNVPRAGTLDYSGDKTLYGGEIVGGLEFARFEFRKREAKFGFELGYSYSQLKTRLASVTSGTLTYNTASYTILSNKKPYPESYAGTYEGPGALIGLNPVNSGMQSSPATATLTSQLTGDFHNIRFGPWLELPWSSRFSTAFSAGYVTIYGKGVLDLTENVTTSETGIPPVAGSTGQYTRTQFIPGAYAQIRLQWRLTELVGVYVGGEFQYNTGLTVNAPTRAARFDFGSTYGGVAGVSLNF